jgi:hypothetical protein
MQQQPSHTTGMYHGQITGLLKSRVFCGDPTSIRLSFRPKGEISLLSPAYSRRDFSSQTRRNDQVHRLLKSPGQITGGIDAHKQLRMCLALPRPTYRGHPNMDAQRRQLLSTNPMQVKAALEPYPACAPGGNPLTPTPPPAMIELRDPTAHQLTQSYTVIHSPIQSQHPRFFHPTH